jgi:hypothetical protein
MHKLPNLYRSRLCTYYQRIKVTRPPKRRRSRVAGSRSVLGSVKSQGVLRRKHGASRA